MAQEIYGGRVFVECSEKWATKTFVKNIESVRQSFSRSFMKFIRTAARELELPLTKHKVLRKRLRLHAYKTQTTLAK